jgi:hypothetical protein
MGGEFIHLQGQHVVHPRGRYGTLIPWLMIKSSGPNGVVPVHCTGATG